MAGTSEFGDRVTAIIRRREPVYFGCTIGSSDGLGYLVLSRGRGVCVSGLDRGDRLLDAIAELELLDVELEARYQALGDGRED